MGLLDRGAGLKIPDTNATLTNISVANAQPVHVQFNPTEYGIDYGARYADQNIPGLDMPLLQFVRGETRTLTLELLLDGYEQRKSSGTDPTITVAGRLAKLREFILVDQELHAPPVVRFQWKEISFEGVFTQLREKYTLFDEEGKLLRARVTATLKSYRSPDVQTRDPARHSPDRTRVRSVRERETLAQLSTEAYGNPRLWRAIAAANGIDRPRFLKPGAPLKIPAIP